VHSLCSLALADGVNKFNDKKASGKRVGVVKVVKLKWMLAEFHVCQRRTFLPLRCRMRGGAARAYNGFPWCNSVAQLNKLKLRFILRQ